MLDLGLFVLAAYFAAAMATVAGFGSSTLLIPIALFFVDFKTAVFLVASFHLFNNLFKVRLFSAAVDLRLFKLFGIPSILLAFAGAQCIAVFPVRILTRVLAAFLLFFSATTFLKPHFRMKATPFHAILGGGLSGFLAGLIGLGGAIRSAFLVNFGLKKEAYVATGALIALVVDLTRVPTYVWQGAAADYVVLPALFVAAYFGVKTGKLFLGKIPQVSFQKIVAAALFLIGLKLLV